MSDAAATFYFIGSAITLVAFTVLFAKRYPGQRGRLGLGIAIGVAAMFLWPVTIWVAVALGLTGFTRPRIPGVPNHQEPPLGFPRKVVVPLSVVAALITLGVIGATADPVPEAERAVAAAPATTTPAPGSGTPAPVITVVDVLDGDTIKLNDGRIVRILGIDAPESGASGKPVECWGPEAAAFARQTLLNTPVTLVGDPTQDLVDDYGRTLSYVVLPDGRDFSVLAAETGHARSYLGDVPAQRFGEISAAESRARAAGLGLWGAVCAPQTPPPTAAQPPPVTSRPLAPQPAAPQPAVPRPTVPQPEAPQPAPKPDPAPAPDPEPDPEPSVYYSNCAEARAAGAAPLYAGDPGYRSGLDRDGDGVACEN